MPETIATQLEQTIRQHRPFDLPVSWADELLFPYYDGLSLTSVPHTVAQILGAPLPHANPLQDQVWQDAAPEAQRVIVILLDGMGYHHLRRLMAEDQHLAQIVADLNGGRDLVPLTSVAPSTTVVALSSLWTGATPSEMSITGTLMFLRQLSLLTNMITFTPMAGFRSHRQDVVAKWGLPPEDIVQAPSLSNYLQLQEIPSYVITNRAYMGTGLSRILHRDVTHAVTHKGYADFIGQVEQTLCDTRGKRVYVQIYWEGIDALAHEYGATHPHTDQEIIQKLSDLRRVLNNPDTMDGETLVMILADHGHQDATQAIRIADDPILTSAMQMSIAGDERHGYMYLRHGTLDAVTTQIDAHYSDCLTYLISQVALENGYFGTQISSELRHRIGDVILLPRPGYILSDPALGTLPMISRHAGLSDWEMLIPLIWQVS
ncbi:MAG: alkaline phosphatase family protein [Anaerolineae bacterium]